MAWPAIVLGIVSIAIGALLLLQARGIVANRHLTPAVRPVFTAAGVLLILNGILQCVIGVAG